MVGKPNKPRSDAAPRRKRGGRKRRGKGGTPPPELTSHPTSRNAYVNTRVWLLDEYGPYCAYCGTKHAARSMTLDHVAPRRGQSAYDRRDNLVLACRTCNAAKKDMAPLAFLLSVKSRAANLLRYGQHLSAGLLELARPIAKKVPREVYGPADDEEDSPYKD
jgi:5-methylcytosine-specific restriction endonuclease McrA